MDTSEDVSREGEQNIFEILKNIVCPDREPVISIGYDPETPEEWIDILTHDYYCWTDIGIDTDKDANFIKKLQMGEVYPNCESDRNIYKNDSFSKKIILSHIGYDEKSSVKVIMNYYSFSKLITLIASNYRYKNTIFLEDAKKSFRYIKPSTFWVSVPVSENVCEILKKHNIGEVIFNSEKNSEDLKTVTLYSKYKFVTSGSTLCELIKYVCDLKKIKPNDNLYKKLCADDLCMVDVFDKLKI